MNEKLVVVGRVVGHYGIKGWVKVVSYTEPLENILRYQPWFVRGSGDPQPVELADGRPHGKGLIAKIGDAIDRDSATQWIGKEILVDRDSFAALDDGSYYWSDLIGLTVETGAGQVLGTVNSVLETGANDVLVVDGERRRLIPFVSGSVVKQVDLKAARITVDWDPDF